MSSRAPAAAAILLVIASAALEGQVPRPFRIGIAGGVTIPLGEDADYYNLGFNGQLAMRIAPAAWPVAVRVEAAMHQLSSKDVNSGPGDTLVLGDFAAFAFGAVAEYAIGAPGPIRPYFLFGAGMYRLESDATLYTQQVSVSDTKTGVNLGFGLSSRGRLYAEFRVHNIFGEGGSARLYPVSIGLWF